MSKDKYEKIDEQVQGQTQATQPGVEEAQATHMGKRPPGRPLSLLPLTQQKRRSLYEIVSLLCIHSSNGHFGNMRFNFLSLRSPSTYPACINV